MLNELQVLSEFTQNDIIKANKELQRRKDQRDKLDLQFQEVDQDTVTLKTKEGQLYTHLN
jgi:hypothetical protein